MRSLKETPCQEAFDEIHQIAQNMDPEDMKEIFKDMVYVHTNYDERIKDLIRQVQILWKARLNDGTEIWSDFREDMENPWIRLKKYCEQEEKYVCGVYAVILGAPITTMFEDPEGLDGIVLYRGAAQDQSLYDSRMSAVSYQTLSALLLKEDGKTVDVRKFSHPENELEPFCQSRILTEENSKFMIFKPNSVRKQCKT